MTHLHPVRVVALSSPMRACHARPGGRWKRGLASPIIALMTLMTMFALGGCVGLEEDDYDYESEWNGEAEDNWQPRMQLGPHTSIYDAVPVEIFSEVKHETYGINDIEGFMIDIQNDIMNASKIDVLFFGINMAVIPSVNFFKGAVSTTVMLGKPIAKEFARGLNRAGARASFLGMPGAFSVFVHGKKTSADFFTKVVLPNGQMSVRKMNASQLAGGMIEAGYQGGEVILFTCHSALSGSAKALANALRGLVGGTNATKPILLRAPTTRVGVRGNVLDGGKIKDISPDW